MSTFLRRTAGFSDGTYADSATIGVELMDDINWIAGVSGRQRQLVVGIAEKLESAVTDEETERSRIGAWIRHRAATDGIGACGIKVDKLGSLGGSVAASICMYAIISAERAPGFNSKAVYAGCRPHSGAIVNNQRLYYYKDTIAARFTRRDAGTPIACIAR